MVLAKALLDSRMHAISRFLVTDDCRELRTQVRVSMFLLMLTEAAATCIMIVLCHDCVK